MELLQHMKVVGSILPDDMRELLLFTHLLGNKNRSDARVPEAARLHDDLSIIALFLFITMLLICILAIAMFVFTSTRTCAVVFLQKQ